MKRSFSHERTCRENIAYLLLGVSLILFISLMIGKTVYSMEKNDSRGHILDDHSVEAEEEYRAQVRDILDELGYRNAGIMLSVVVEGDGNRDYTLRINHRKLTDDSSAGVRKTQELKQRIGALSGILTDSDVEVIF